ncbi:unnamed protein product [Rotaria socialis]
MDIGASIATSPDFIDLRQWITHNVSLIWLDESFDQSTEICQHTLAPFRNIVHDVNIFTSWDECINFVTKFNGMKAFLVIKGTIDSQIMSLIHDLPQLGSIFIYCKSISYHEQEAKNWSKIKCAHTEIESIRKALQLAVKQFNQDSISISFLPKSEETSKINLNQLPPSFMYTQILKEILIEMEHDDKSLKDFIKFWHEQEIQYGDKNKRIDEFERTYSAEGPINWYVKKGFIYDDLNRGLRELNSDIIIKMGVFIHDLHQKLNELQQGQARPPLPLYRGQGLSKTDFEKLNKSKNGLISFNNFLSTSKDSITAMGFAEIASELPDMVGIFFEMTIPRSVQSVPFADIQEYSEKESE